MTASTQFIEALGPFLIKGLALTASIVVFAPLLAAFVAPFFG